MNATILIVGFAAIFAGLVFQVLALANKNRRANTTRALTLWAIGAALLIIPQFLRPWIDSEKYQSEANLRAAKSLLA